MAAPKPGTPAPYRQERHVDTSGQEPHPREEVGIAGKVHAGRPGDEDAQSAPRGRKERAAAAVFGMDGFQRQVTDLQSITGSKLVNDPWCRL